MNRTRMPHTPYLDAWREELRAATDGHGLKTELATFISTYRGQPLHTWKVGIGRILRGAIIPNGEDVLAINHWIGSRMESQKHSPESLTHPCVLPRPLNSADDRG